MDEFGIEKFGIIINSEKTTAILGDRWWSQTAKREGDNDKQKVSRQHMEKNAMSAQMLEVPLLGVGTVLRLERDAWSMVK